MTVATGPTRSTTAAPHSAAPPARQRFTAFPRFRFIGLDGFQALTVVLALGYGLIEIVGQLHPPAPVRHLVAGSFIAADLYLVLGGFLIGRYLLEPGARTGRVIGRLLLRLVPLHVLAWAVAYGWLGSPLVTTPLGTAHGWLFSGLLLSGIAGPDQAGYPLAWALSIGLWTGAAVIVLVKVVSVAFERLAQLRPFGAAARFGRAARISPVDPAGPVRLTALIAVLVGVALLITDSRYTVGTGAVGRGLLGMGVGLLTVLRLHAGSGDVRPPTAKTVVQRRFPAGPGVGLATAGLLFCVYRTDLMLQLHLLPVFGVAAMLVFFLARLSHTRTPIGRNQPDLGPLPRALSSRPGRWLGSRALAGFVLHGSIVITVVRVNAQLGADFATAPVIWRMLAEVLLGTLVAADLAYRLLDRRSAAHPTPVPVGGPSFSGRTVAVPTVAVSAKPIAAVDAQATPVDVASLPLGAQSIPPELRLRPRSRRDTAAPRLLPANIAVPPDRCAPPTTVPSAKNAAPPKNAAPFEDAAAPATADRPENVDLTEKTVDLTTPAPPPRPHPATPTPENLEPGT
jgi:hypothetical protein